jgi:integrase/recombinase XerD
LGGHPSAGDASGLSDDGAGRASPADLDAIATFVDALWLEEGLSRNTLDAYRRDLTLLAQWLAGRGASLMRAGEAELNGYFSARHSATRATTANRRLTVFKRFFRWALREHLLTQDPTLRLQAARQARYGHRDGPA